MKMAAEGGDCVGNSGCAGLCSNQRISTGETKSPDTDAGGKHLRKDCANLSRDTWSSSWLRAAIFTFLSAGEVGKFCQHTSLGDTLKTTVCVSPLAMLTGEASMRSPVVEACAGKGSTSSTSCAGGWQGENRHSLSCMGLS